MIGIRWIAVWAAFVLLALPSLSFAEHHEVDEETVAQGCGETTGHACGKAAGCDCAAAGHDCAKGAEHKCGDAATCTCGKHAKPFDAPQGAGI